MPLLVGGGCDEEITRIDIHLLILEMNREMPITCASMTFLFCSRLWSSKCTGNGLQMRGNEPGCGAKRKNVQSRGRRRCRPVIRLWATHLTAMATVTDLPSAQMVIEARWSLTSSVSPPQVFLLIHFKAVSDHWMITRIDVCAACSDRDRQLCSTEDR